MTYQELHRELTKLILNNHGLPAVCDAEVVIDTADGQFSVDSLSITHRLGEVEIHLNGEQIEAAESDE